MKHRILSSKLLAIACCISLFTCSCSKSSTDDGTPVTPVTPPAAGASDISYYITSGDKSKLLLKQTAPLIFSNATTTFTTINVDSAVTYQSIDGFGYTLTQGSASVINQLDATTKASLLNELFGSSDNSIGISYLRIGMGATDLSATVYSYDDMPAGQTDPTLANFSLSQDASDMIPVLKAILLIDPNVKILATPWSPPVWMKTGSTSAKGGSLNTAYYSTYANYFVKYIEAMQAQGIRIDAITPQNEPLNPDNTPSLSMNASEQTNFIKNNLGPAFVSAGINAKIIAYDHNLDRTDYPLAVLADAAANAFVDGSAFHLYAGDISAMSAVHAAYPNKNVYFTEQYTASTGSFSGDLNWHIKNVIIGSMRNWGKVALEWNLANDPNYGPHTIGGCTTCLGGLTIGTGNITRNVGYYIVAHASKFVPAGSKRISSDSYTNLNTAAFLRPDGKKVMIVLNDGGFPQSFSIKYKGKIVNTSLSGNSVATYVW